MDANPDGRAVSGTGSLTIESNVLHHDRMALDAMLVVRFPQDVKDALRRAAEEDDRSMSSLALILVRQGLVARGYLDEPVKRVRGRRRK